MIEKEETEKQIQKRIETEQSEWEESMRVTEENSYQEPEEPDKLVETVFKEGGVKTKLREPTNLYEIAGTPLQVTPNIIEPTIRPIIKAVDYKYNCPKCKTPYVLSIETPNGVSFLCGQCNPLVLSILSLKQQLDLAIEMRMYSESAKHIDQDLDNFKSGIEEFNVDFDTRMKKMEQLLTKHEKDITEIIASFVKKKKKTAGDKTDNGNG